MAIPCVAEPEEITRLVLFVASDEASFSTGSEFIVDGGVRWDPCRSMNAPTRPCGLRPSGSQAAIHAELA